LCEGRYYQKEDNTTPPSPPSGPELHIDWNEVCPIKTNAKYSDYERWPDLLAAVKDFADYYRDFLKLLTAAYSGQPQLLMEAVAKMFQIRNKINAIIRNPLPDSCGLHAAPIFVHHSISRS
jgi:hypothetical protein